MIGRPLEDIVQRRNTGLLGRHIDCTTGEFQQSVIGPVEKSECWLLSNICRFGHQEESLRLCWHIRQLFEQQGCLVAPATHSLLHGALWHVSILRLCFLHCMGALNLNA